MKRTVSFTIFLLLVKRFLITSFTVCLLLSFRACSLYNTESTSIKNTANNRENKQPLAKIQIDSEWLASGTTGPVEVSGPYHSDGWTDWSSPLITSEWNGAPWSCIRVRLFKNMNAYSNSDLTFQLDSDWVSLADTSEKVTDWAYPGADYTSWSDYAITSEWNGAS